MEDMDFGQRVLELRKKLGIGQSALARIVGVSRQVVYQWESAGTKPEKVEVVLAVAAELKTSISYLYGETDDPRPAPQWRTGEGPTSEWEARVEQAKLKLAEATELLSPEPLVSPERAELLRIASTSARGSTLYPEQAAKPAKPSKAKAQGE